MLNNNDNLNMQTGRFSKSKGYISIIKCFLNIILVIKSLPVFLWLAQDYDALANIIRI